MKTNYSKIEDLFNKNNGFITHKEVVENNIPTWFLTDFVRKNKLEKDAKGFYSSPYWVPDGFYIFQYRYPKFIFSFDSALYLHHLTDKQPFFYEVTGPNQYHPFKDYPYHVITHRDSRDEIYNLGITTVETNFGNKVRVYSPEKTICDLIRFEHKVEGETLVKALYLYRDMNNKDLNTLMEYAKIMGIEYKVYNFLMVVMNEP